MSEKIVTVAVYSSSMAAQMARNQLLAEGIAAQLVGEVSSGPLPGMESFFANIQLLIPESELERASEILGLEVEDLTEQEIEEEDEPSSEAICESDSTGIREPRDQELPPSTAVRAPLPGEQPPEPLEETGVPPSFYDSEGPEEMVDRPFALTAEVLGNRAFRAAIASSMILTIEALLATPLFSLLAVVVAGYSLWLVYRMESLTQDLSTVGKIKLYVALLVDVVVVAIGGYHLIIFTLYWTIRLMAG